MADVGKIHTSDPTRPFKQDLPPKGGYAPINFKRIPARKIVNAPILFGGLIFTQVFGFWIYKRRKAIFYRERLEEDSLQRALEPMLLAERDRELLRQLRKNREYEAELMKDVPGWEVGTWFGQRVYKKLSDSEWMDPQPGEFYAFSHPFEAQSELMYKQALVM